MFRIAIYDDTREHCEQLVGLIRGALRGRRAELECFPSTGELLRYIREGNYAPDAAFLGVRLRDGDGVALGETLNALVPACRIVFLSDELSDAREVYRAEHVWFLLHAELEQRIGPALEKALALPEPWRGRAILVRGKGRACLVPTDKLLYLERECRKTVLHTEEGEICSSERPSRLLEGEPAESFIRSHMSYWVNRGKIEAMERDEFVLGDGTRVPISRSFRAAARAAFLADHR